MRFFVICLTLLSACAQTPEHKPSTSAAAQPVATKNHPYSFEQLHQVALYGATLITADVDAKFSKKKRQKILACDPQVEKMSIWMNQIKSLIDMQTAELQAKYLSMTENERMQNYAKCEETCLCGAYAEFIDSIEPTQLTPQDRSLIENLREKQNKTTARQEKYCIANTKWFCGSDLEKELKKITH